MCFAPPLLAQFRVVTCNGAGRVCSYPEGVMRLERADTQDAVRQVASRSAPEAATGLVHFSTRNCICGTADTTRLLWCRGQYCSHESVLRRGGVVPGGGVVRSIPGVVPGGSGQAEPSLDLDRLAWLGTWAGLVVLTCGMVLPVQPRQVARGLCDARSTVCACPGSSAAAVLRRRTDALVPQVLRVRGQAEQARFRAAVPVRRVLRLHEAQGAGGTAAPKTVPDYCAKLYLPPREAMSGAGVQIDPMRRTAGRCATSFGSPSALARTKRAALTSTSRSSRYLARYLAGYAGSVRGEVAGGGCMEGREGGGEGGGREEFFWNEEEVAGTRVQCS
eukprot:1831044-Rhodomonas_salina.2